jgi:hypothetical protein
MDTINARHLLHVMIEYFETGNKITDGAAKSILASDFEYSDFWQQVIQNLKNGVEWSGIRAVEADIMVSALRHIDMLLDDRKGKQGDTID